MPTVPIYQRQTAPEMAPVNNVNLRLPQQGLGEQLAEVGGNYMQAIGQQKQKQDLADMQDMVNQFSVFADDLYNNPQNGLVTLQGKNAIGQGEARAGQISAKATEMRDSLPEYMRPMFDQQIQPLGRSYGNKFRQYDVGQKQQYEAQVYSSGNELAEVQARGLWNDPVAFGEVMQSRFEATDMYADAYGMPDEWRVAQKVKTKERAASSALDTWIADDPLGYITRNGEPSDVGGVARTPVQGGSSLALGIENNNPGNIEFSDKNPWEGQTGSDGRFAKFATPEHGIRALGKNLLSYNRLHGLDTVGGIITRWAPPKENKTEAYIKAICDRLGVGANDQIDVTNPRTLAELCAGIIRQENGKDSASTISADQISNGVSAALGITALESPKRYNGNTVYDAASPQDQARANRYAMQVLNQRRAQQSDLLDQQVKNIYAATDEGQQPDYVPSQQSFIDSAKNPTVGLRKWQDMQEQLRYGGVIAASKDMSPTAREALLEEARPTDPNSPNFAAQQQRWSKMKAKFSELDKEWERNQGRTMVTNALNNGVALDPSNKSNKDAADSYFDSNLSNFNIKNNEDVNAVTSFVAKTGIIPTKLSSQLNAASAVKDPNVAIPAAELVSRIYDTNPAALSNMPKEKQSFYLNAKRLKDAGVDPKEAVEQAYNLAYNQTDSLKAQLASEQGSSSYKKDRLKAASDFVSDRSQFFRIDPSAKDTNTDAARFRQDYESLYDLNYRVSGGDADIAKKLTSQQIARAWSISEVNGSAQLMKYAPEALYQGGPSGWQAQQWEEEKQRLTYGEKSDPIETSTNALGATSGRPGVATTTTPERKVKGDVILVPDVSTPRNGDYAIMISDKDKDGVPTLQPYYDADGRPLRYRPDLESWKPYQELLTDQKVSVEQTMQKAQERRGFYDTHREFDNQYQEGHEKRIEKQKTQLKNYFRWGKE
ncbi:hypothetical protein ABQ333_04970 [Serratia fonticola]|uniref:hypothetical protein n=1 Tax=Serratia fonticola TaxID=47917 RepID=UPI003AAE9F89